MRQIELQRDDLLCLVDDEDYEKVVNYGTWYWDGRYVKHKRNGKRNGPDQPRDPPVYTYLHRLIMGTPPNYDTDHIDGNTLDNRRSNLRICTRAQNSVNRDTIGVYWSHAREAWYAMVSVSKHQYMRGYFVEIDDAIDAYYELSDEHFGEFNSRRRELEE